MGAYNPQASEGVKLICENESTAAELRAKRKNAKIKDFEYTEARVNTHSLFYLASLAPRSSLGDSHHRNPGYSSGMCPHCM